jgi:hypothetical protein
MKKITAIIDCIGKIKYILKSMSINLSQYHNYSHAFEFIDFGGGLLLEADGVVGKIDYLECIHSVPVLD